MRWWVSMALLWALALGPPTASAHKPSDSYLSLDVSERTVRGRWDIALRDLDHAIGLDGNGDGAITWGELRGRHEAIAAYALSRLTLAAGRSECRHRLLEHLVDRHSDGAYEVLRFEADCARPVETLEIAYGLLFDVDPQHRGLVRVGHGDVEHTAILTIERSTRRLDLAVAEPWRQFLDYVREGVWHIWIGIDHILFLLTLLLPAVVERRHGRWCAVDGVGDAFVEVAKIVTAFTLAHSATLGLAATGVLVLPSRLVESLIAASVVIVALNNLFPLVTRRAWLMAFAFGLVHGLGFAGVISALGLPEGAAIRSLLGFNIGVELGQLAIVAAILPVSFRLRSMRFYRRVVLGLGSSVIAAIGCVWLVERAFQITLPVS